MESGSARADLFIMRSAFLFVALCSASMGSPATNLAQSQVVPSAPTCRVCSLSLDRVITLGSVDDPAVGTTNTVLVDSEGRMLLHHDMMPSELAVFDPAGRHARSVGRSGEGPGEFQFIITAAIGPGDSVHVFDRALARETILSSSLDVIRTIPLPGPLREVAFVRDGGLVIQGNIRNTDMIGFPLHLLDRERNVVRSFGSEDQVFRPDMPIMGLRRLEQADSTSVWSAYLNQYVIERWTVEGDKVGEIRREVDWFEPWYYSTGLSLAEPPKVEVTDLQQDDAGRLWVLLRVPGQDWQSGLGEMQGPDGPGVGIIDWDALFDTVVEVIDPEAGTLVYSGRVAPYLMGFNNRGMGIGYREGPEGVPYIDLWRIELEGDS